VSRVVLAGSVRGIKVCGFVNVPSGPRRPITFGLVIESIEVDETLSTFEKTLIELFIQQDIDTRTKCAGVRSPSGL
jgi:hypothetical protein